MQSLEIKDPPGEKYDQQPTKRPPRGTFALSAVSVDGESSDVLERHSATVLERGKDFDRELVEGGKSQRRSKRRRRKNSLCGGPTSPSEEYRPEKILREKR